MAEEPISSRRCRACGRGATLDQTRCPSCGAPFPEEAAPAATFRSEAPGASTPCPACGAPLAAGAVVCIDCGFDKRKGRRLDVGGAGPPRRKRSQGGRSARAPASTLGRSLAAWLVIAVGLAGVVGGIGMIYIHSVGQSAAIEDARAQARLFGTESVPVNTHATETYTVAIAAIVFGLVVAFVGVGLRPARPSSESRGRRPGEETNGKQACSACGALSPPQAAKCYHCGQAFAGG